MFGHSKLVVVLSWRLRVIGGREFQLIAFVFLLCECNSLSPAWLADS